MPDILSEDEIKNILTKEPEKGPVITYDFKHPARVSKDQQRTLENLHSNLSRMLASSFSAIQQSVVDCDIAFVDQTTYAEFIHSLGNPACSYTFSMKPLGGPAILDFSLPIVYSFIDREFGGTGASPPSEARVITAIERSVMAGVATRSLADLESTWEPLLKIQVADAELETNPEFMQIAAPSDTVILIAFEINTQHASGLVRLCYPYYTLGPVMAYLNVQTWASRDRRRGGNVRENRVEQLVEIDMPLNDVVALEIGDVLKFDTRTDEPAVVFVGDRPKFLARPTRIGDRTAVQITEPISKVDEVRYMSSVQKTETGVL